MNRAAWIALSCQRHIGGKTLRHLLAHFDHDLDAVLAADKKALMAVRGVGPAIADAITRIDMTAAERAIAQWAVAGVQMLLCHDATYPFSLLALDDEPPTLFVRGLWRPERLQPSVAVVGTRQASQQALAIAHEIGRRLALASRTVVSGMATGIDAAAHRGTMDVGGYTIAILGSGVLRPYPPENARLVQQIMDNGALASEVAPDASPGAAKLVARNRIISGMCHSVIVVETSAQGGAMYAVRAASTQNRRVHVLDLPADGNQQLLAEGDTVPLSADLNSFDPTRL